MKTFCITSLGCKVNQYESHKIAQFLIEQGFKQVLEPSSADLAIVHTCCVTHSASSKSRQMIRRALKLSSHCKVVATGCLPDADKQEIGDLDSLAAFVSKKDDLKQALLNIISHSTISRTANAYKIKDKNDFSEIKPNKISNLQQQPDNIQPLEQNSRAFLKIQDGCDGFCSYCIIPKIRTKISSRDQIEILEEAKQIVDEGHKEIVLTGIFLGAYGQDTVKRKNWDNQKQNGFIELVAQIADIKGLKRLRLSSLEPGDVTDELLELFNKHHNIAPHLHLSLQSGSSRILKKMNRQYDAEQFKDCLRRVKLYLDRPAITTDIIVGFPGETEQDFNETIEMVKFAEFAKIHVFSFSRRKGTAAYNMKGQIPSQIIKQRSTALSELDKQLQKEFRQKFAGEKISVVVENEKHQTGRCERYFEVKLKNTTLERGDFTFATLQDDCFTAIV